MNLGSTYAPDRIGLLILDGRLTEARTQLEEYTQKSGDDEDGWLMLGDVYRALGDDSRARVTDARAAQIAPEYVGLRRPDLRKLSQRSTPSWNATRNAPDSEALKTDEQGRTALMRAAAQGRGVRSAHLQAIRPALSHRRHRGAAALDREARALPGRVPAPCAYPRALVQRPAQACSRKRWKNRCTQDRKHSSRRCAVSTWTAPSAMTRRWRRPTRRRISPG